MAIKKLPIVGEFLPEPVENSAGKAIVVNADEASFTIGSIPLYSETDPIFTASPAHGIDAFDIANWNTAYGWGNHAGLYELTGTASGLIGTHESTYDHTLIATALQSLDGAWLNDTNQTDLTGDKSGSFDLTTTGIVEGIISALSGSNVLLLDQTTPQTFTSLGGGTGLLKVTAGLLGLDTSTYAYAAALSGTINEIAYFNSATTITSLAVATYPSLTELSYIKGLSSAIQTQLNGKAATGQTFYIGTTQVAINRASAALTLAGITLTTPDIGTPSAGTLTNCTGLPVDGIVGNTTSALGVGTLELGHASDTTIARSAAGVITVEGNQVYTATKLPDFIVFPVQSAKVGHLSTTAAKIEGGYNRWYLQFDPDTSRFADFQFIMPATYNTAQTLTVKLMWTNTVASNNVVWNAALMAMTSGDAALLETDSFDTANATTTAASATIGRPVTTSITMTNKDSVAAGDICILRISRNASSGSDTNTGVAQLAGIIMEWN